MCRLYFSHVKVVVLPGVFGCSVIQFPRGSPVNPVKELIPNHIYQFKRPFDAYFCMDGRVQVAKDAICECKRADSVSATLYFFDSDKNLPFEAACYISKRCSEYLVDITGTEAAERRNL